MGMRVAAGAVRMRMGGGVIMRMRVRVFMRVIVIMIMVIVGVSVRMSMIVHMGVIMLVVVIMMMIVGVRVRVTRAPQALEQHPTADGDDGKSRDRSQDLRHLLRHDVLEQEQRGESQQEHRHRMRERHHGAQEGCMFERAARAHQISRDDGLAVSGSQCVRGAENKRDADCRRDHPRSERLLVQQARQGVVLRRGALQEGKQQCHWTTKPCMVACAS